MEKLGGELPQASTGLRRDCHRNRPEAARSRIDGPLYESSDGFALKTSCRVHPKRPIKFPPLVHSFGSFQSPASTNLKGFSDSLSSPTAGEGGNHGCEGDFGKEVCCEADRRGTRTA